MSGMEAPSIHVAETPGVSMEVRATNVEIHNHGIGATELRAVFNKLEHIMSALTELQAAVAAESTVIDSAITLLQGLKAKLDAAGTDPVALKALSDDIGARTQSLSSAITANTPSTE